MATFDTLREVVRDLLPSGPFWLSEAVASYVEALASAFVEIVDFIESLPDTINPLTAARAVLVDWWEYIRSTCSATPTDTEDLRERVLAALAAPLSYTFQGLQAVVSANVPGTVVLRELPALSEVPFDVPADVNEHARILEVWFSPLLTSEAQLRCVLGAFAQAADALRLVSPDATLHVVDTQADEQAFRWVHAYAPADLAIERVRGDTGAVSNTLYELDEENAAATLATILAVVGSTYLSGDALSWHVERDGTQVSATRRNAVAEFRDAVGVMPSLLCLGQGRELINDAAMTASGTATQSTLSGVSEVFGTSAYNFDGSGGAVWTCADGSLGGVPTAESRAFFLIYRPRTIPVNGALAGKQNGTSEGWNLLQNSLVPQLTVRDSTLPPATTVELTAASAVEDAWRCLCVIFDRTNAQLRFASDLEAASNVALPAQRYDPPADPLRIGDSRTPPSTVNSTDCEIGLFAEVQANVPSLVAQTAAAALLAKFLNG
jgi:hypothetical protein